MTDSGASFTPSGLVSYKIHNDTDNSYCTITSNDATSITCSGGLSGGNSWSSGETYRVVNADGGPAIWAGAYVATPIRKANISRNIFKDLNWEAIQPGGQDTIIANNQIINAKEAGIYISDHNGYNFNIVGNNFHNITMKDISSSCIEIQDINGALISNNICNTSDHDGIAIQNSYNIQVVNNTISNCSEGGADVYSGIRLIILDGPGSGMTYTTCSNVVIANNQIWQTNSKQAQVS